VEANNGESLTQLAPAGVGVTRVGNFSVADAIAKGEFMPQLEDFSPGDRDTIHAVFVGGGGVPARIRGVRRLLGRSIAATVGCKRHKTSRSSTAQNRAAFLCLMIGNPAAGSRDPNRSTAALPT
jgi:hypothetical protein